MTFQVRLLAGAQRDFDEVVAWYETEAPDHVAHFIDEFFATARRLQQFPYSAPEVHNGARRVSLRIFPYQAWYRLLSDAQVIEIVGPARLARRLEGPG